MAPEAGLKAMLAHVRDLPAQLEAAPRLPGLADLAPPSVPIRDVLVCGMGGSAIAGDLVQPLLADGPVSLTVWRDYGLPPWVGPEDLVIASSYSGNTEETLAATAAALDRGCRMIGMGSGGELAALAGSAGFPLIVLPGGLPPRASLGLGLGALLGLLDGWGLVRDLRPQLQAACAGLRRAAPARAWFAPAASGATDYPADPDGNPPAALLARALDGRIPVIFTAGTEAHPVGRRFKAQLNENSKVPAFLAEFPELDHNDLVGWDLPADRREGFALVVMKCGPLSDRLERRVSATLNLVKDDFSFVSVVTAAGRSPLDRVLSLVQYGDFVSCHLAGWRQVDPVPVVRIESLKRTLAGGADRG